MLLLPWRKDHARDASVHNDGARTTISWNAATAIIDPDCYSFTEGSTTIVTAFGSAPCQAAGITVEGGAAEVRLQPGRATITAHGAPGPRSLSLPGAWTPAPPIAIRDGRYLLDYAGSEPITVTLNPETGGN